MRKQQLRSRLVSGEKCTPSRRSRYTPGGIENKTNESSSDRAESQLKRSKSRWPNPVLWKSNWGLENAVSHSQEGFEDEEASPNPCVLEYRFSNKSFQNVSRFQTVEGITLA
eukprot:Gregarina_sp_Pseudo_9__5154@NODE_549_length_2597_cov_18_668882_g519_i0_p5_GENE_NODE_549_length_2597_cov_18_668882_g519_i0NODE_549_length_2597_cov_18_668882_g519_i0_p5_ORF_typecomplete_len112_score10_41DUF5013/PF16405_5/0_0084_NODE_549_length_2597_cov_18_668882_g519_i010141349